MMDDSLTITLIPGGHAFYAERAYNGDLTLEIIGDEHSGPMCARCFESRCDACDERAGVDDIRTEPCKAVRADDALPGLTLEELP